MNKKLFFGIFLLILVSVLTGCAKTAVIKDIDADFRNFEFSITDSTYFHNVGIAFDGANYYTINGGNSDFGIISKYDKKGKYIEKNYSRIDGRSVFYSKKAGKLIIKPMDTYLFEYDFSTNDYEEIEIDYDVEENASIAITPDCKYVVSFSDGAVFIHNFSNGKFVRKFEVSDYDYLDGRHYMSVAASDNLVFIWGDSYRIDVYDFNGGKRGSIKVDGEYFGMSLTYCNGMLWLAEDANGNNTIKEGRWKGLKLK